jgi:hypothetical protein
LILRNSCPVYPGLPKVSALFFKNTYQISNSKGCSESCNKFLFRISFALIGRYFPVYCTVYIHGRLSEIFSGSRAPFGTTFRVTRGYRTAGTSSLKRVTGRIFTITVVMEASRNFIFDFLRQKKPKIVKTISAHSKSTVLIFRTAKKIFIITLSL